jgi:nitrogen fixation/metabolism regulation signal transduction histidine kinase
MVRLRFERSLALMAFSACLPGLALAGFLLIRAGEMDVSIRWLLFALAVLLSAWIAWMLVGKVVFPLRTLANLLGGIREGDFSMRARGAVSDDALGDVFLETNALGQTLLEQRLGALEASALLRSVMVELDVAVFAFDDQSRLKLANRAGEALLRRPSEQLLDRSAEELGLAECLTGEPQRALTMSFPAGNGRYALRRSAFRQGGRPHRLVVLADLGRVLRDEERAAWQRLLRVLGHEIYNSLAPIKSITGTLSAMTGRDPLPPDWREDTRAGLGIIHSRADSLARFIDAYSRLAKLPPPRPVVLSLEPLIRRIAALETRIPVTVVPSPAVTVTADPDQLEQMLINLVRNAVDASLAAEPGAEKAVTIHWLLGEENVEIQVADTGLGIANPANLFVPFFTTKPGGSGIGLTLCRQIAEAHSGSLTLENRSDARGAVAALRLPVRGPGT